MVTHLDGRLGQTGAMSKTWPVSDVQRQIQELSGRLAANGAGHPGPDRSSAVGNEGRRRRAAQAMNHGARYGRPFSGVGSGPGRPRPADPAGAAAARRRADPPCLSGVMLRSPSISRICGPGPRRSRSDRRWRLEARNELSIEVPGSQPNRIRPGAQRRLRVMHAPAQRVPGSGGAGCRSLSPGQGSRLVSWRKGLGRHGFADGPTVTVESSLLRRGW